MALPADFGLKYTTAKRSAATQRDATISQNAYSRFLSKTRGTRNMVDLDRGMTRGLEGFAGSFGKRGLGNSGIWQQGQTDYATKWNTSRQGIYDEMDAADRAADLGDASAWGQYNNTEADLDLRKQSEILATAAGLEEFRPFLGA